MNLPNRLTLLRLFLVIPFIVIMSLSLTYTSEELSYSLFNTKTILFIVGGLIFIFAMITDFLDGYLARKNNQVTSFGKLFDPLADKFMTSSGFIFLILFKLVPLWIPLIMILRDILVDGSRNVAAKNKIEVSANVFGKVKTVLQTLTLILFFSIAPIIEGKHLFMDYVYDGNWRIWSMNIITLIAMISSIISGWIYFSKIKNVLKEDN